jgi:hypothetical protein
MEKLGIPQTAVRTEHEISVRSLRFRIATLPKSPIERGKVAIFRAPAAARDSNRCHVRKQTGSVRAMLARLLWQSVLKESITPLNVSQPFSPGVIVPRIMPDGVRM